MRLYCGKEDYRHVKSVGVRFYSDSLIIEGSLSLFLEAIRLWPFLSDFVSMVAEGHSFQNSHR